ncbi:MAG: UPF0182 family protein [Eubacteriaceae bacterium]
MSNRKSFKKMTYIIIAVISVIVMLFSVLNQFYINFMWFDEVGYTQVFLKELVTKLQIGVPCFFILFIILFFYFKLLNKVINKKVAIQNYKYKNRILIIISTALSLFITLITTNSLWYKILEYVNSTEFNLTDPIFNKDISFFVFKLPLLEQLYVSLSSVFFILLFSTVIYSALIYLNSNSRVIQSPENGRIDLMNLLKSFGQLASKQIGIFLGIFFILLSFNYYIKTFGLLYSTTGIAYGASYTDENITLWLYRILIFLSLGLGVFSIFFGLRRKLKAIAILPVVMIIVSFVGGLVSYGVESFLVAPNQLQKEEPYLVRNIKYTQAAYGIEEVEEKEFPADDEITLEDLEENEITIKNIPINDYRPTLDMYNSIQGFRIYYEFNDIDIDRYNIDGEYTQVFISAREMNNNKLEENAKTWINQHLKYTHGFGIAVSPVNQVNEAGQPALAVKDIPPQTSIDELEVTEPRIYFGEMTDTYAITNCVTQEFDYPEGSDNVENYYEGNAGIKMNFINRLAFSLYHGNFKIFLSSDITSESKMLIKRDITERVNAIAPFLAYDEDPYIVVADGKLYWIMDAFTLSNRYPYSQPYNDENSFNYLRNSVKVVVDAYNGDVNFYQIDNEDPIANVYSNIYPELLKSIDEMPEEIKSHVRYSQKMFDIQANIYRTYHMNNPRVFYNKEDQWEIATQMYGQGKEVEEVESAYLIMKQPERDDEEFVLMVPYTPRQKDNLVAWMAAMNDADQYGKLLVYRFPKQNLAYGPMQIEQRIDQDTEISPQLTLLGQQGSEIIRGNMLTIPINDSILYVEPIYIGASSGESNMPEVKKVIVSYNNKIIMDENLKGALEKLIGVAEEDTEEPSDYNTGIDDDISSLIIKANELFEKAQEAQKNGDWSKYGEYIDNLEQVLNKLNTIN